MQRFRRLFTLLFILSLFVGAIHESSHAHQHGDTCEVCVLSHAPALLGDASIVIPIDHYYENFSFMDTSYPVVSSILTRNRSPPLT
ncbi:MAG: hypothetical protein Q8R58_00785 [Sulfuricurvum sp.]|nr:hypothetical protein [Sulfuricurvum sp.]